MIPLEDLERRFKFHPADKSKGDRHHDIRNWCRELAFTLNNDLPDGREKSLAITHLEEVMMWANAAIAREGQ